MPNTTIDTIKTTGIEMISLLMKYSNAQPYNLLNKLGSHSLGMGYAIP